MKRPFYNTKLAGAALLVGLTTIAWDGRAAAQDLDDPDAHCSGYSDEAVSDFGGYQQEGDQGYAVIPGFTFGCTIQDSVTGNRTRVKPKFCNVDGGRFPVPSGREACHQMIDNAINNACQADGPVSEPGYEFFSSSAARERFAGCLPVFRGQARQCVAHFKLMRPHCDGGETVADQPGSDDGQEAVAEQSGSGDSSQRTDAPEPNCAGAQEGTECWKETANQPGCYVWDDHLQPSQTVEWSGSCTGSIADGPGTTTWSSEQWPASAKGVLSDGKRDGRWVERRNVTGHGPGETWREVLAGNYVNGKAQGRFFRYTHLPNSQDVYLNSHVYVATFTNGRLEGEWESLTDKAWEEYHKCPMDEFGNARCLQVLERAVEDIVRRTKAAMGIN